MLILYSTLVMLGLSLFLGIMIAVFAKVFEVKVDPRVKAISEVLPGYNCGACGYAGCDVYAENIIENGIKRNLCTPGGGDVAKKIEDICNTTVEEQA